MARSRPQCALLRARLAVDSTATFRHRWASPRIHRVQQSALEQYLPAAGERCCNPSISRALHGSANHSQQGNCVKERPSKWMPQELQSREVPAGPSRSFAFISPSCQVKSLPFCGGLCIKPIHPVRPAKLLAFTRMPKATGSRISNVATPATSATIRPGPTANGSPRRKAARPGLARNCSVPNVRRGSDSA